MNDSDAQDAVLCSPMAAPAPATPPGADSGAEETDLRRPVDDCGAGEAGPAHGLKHAGLEALNSLRLEKGYRDYGHDIVNIDTPLEAGLGFEVKLDKPGGFIGQGALAILKQAGVQGGDSAESGGTLKALQVRPPGPRLHGRNRQRCDR